MKYSCPCCGYKTFNEKTQGTYVICPVCFWEDDYVKDPDEVGGANRVSLRVAQINFAKYGACVPEMKKFVRAPMPNEERDVYWNPLKI